MQLSHDDVQVKRVPKNVRLEETPNVRLEGGTTIIPVVEEVLVVEKALMLVEEIHIERRSTSEDLELPVTLRKECASVERDAAPAQASDMEGDVK
jgi:stress response protein YsnF